MPVYLISFGTTFITIFLNDSFSGFYKYNQWSVMMSSPIFYLAMLLNVAVIILPRCMAICIDRVVVHPEFTKIRGE